MAAYMFESTGELVESLQDEASLDKVVDDFLAKGAAGRYLLSSKNGNWYTWILLHASSHYHWWQRIDDLENVPTHLRALALILK